MAPALTKFLKDGHGIHLSSPPASNDQSIMTVMEVHSQIRPSEDLQKMLFSVLPTLDSNLQANPLDLPSSTAQRESLVHPSVEGSDKTYKNKLKEPHLVPSILPGALDMLFLPNDSGHHRQKTACQHKPGVCDLPPLCSLSNVSPCVENGDYNCVLDTANVSNQKNSRMDHLVPTAELQSQIKKSVSRQRGLQVRAQELQRRLEAALGQHAVLHCDQQLEGLGTCGLLDHGNISAHSEFSRGDSQQYCPWPQTNFTELKEFSRSSRALLRDLQDTLDSEATASSSSDDELVEIKTPSKKREACVASCSCERRWLKERAELGSRWTWLQLRIAELDGRIQQLLKLNKNIHSTKGSVVLADPQPITVRQMKSALLRGAKVLSRTMVDTDNDPCSPTRLLHNIQRQSAQLSRIVNSLMSPLNLSPISKSPWPRKDKEAFDGSSKRRKFDMFKDDRTCVCARTRPLVAYRKPRLFRLNSSSSNSGSKCSSMSGLSSCFCSHCSSSSGLVLGCSDSVNGSNGILPSGMCSSSSADSSLFSHCTKGTAREEWSQIPLVVNASPLSAVHYKRRSSTPLYNSDKCKPYTYCHKNRILGLSSIGRHCGLQKEDRVHQKKRKRRHRLSFTEDEDESLLYCDSSDELSQENFMLVLQQQNTSRKASRKRNGETRFDINNIVIPASLTKVEKLQYKDILTPSWQILNKSTFKDEGLSKKDKDEEIEVLTDEVFAQRHLPFEQKEKMRWSFVGARHWRHSLRSGRRLSRSEGKLCTSGEDNSVEWSFTQLDTDEQLSSEKCLQPKTPWERRVFPLNHDEETAISSEVLQWCSDSTCTISSSTSLNSDRLSSESTRTTSPSGGHFMDCLNNGS